MKLLYSVPVWLAVAKAFAAPSSDPQHTFSLDPIDYHVSAHPQFPGHYIRARRPKLCEHVVEWSGYLDLPDGRHLYWHSYESRNRPETDPVMLWLNGGPGCSSFCGMLQELGPCSVNKNSSNDKVYLTYNDYSWSNNATLLFLDQPVGTGYSYADRGDKGVWTTETAAVDVFTFLQLWFKAFEHKFGKADFHIGGESYAGRYIPVFADYIVNGFPPINLKSILIGNGFTHPELQYASYVPVVCEEATGYGPYLNKTTCDTMRSTLPKCREYMRRCAANQTDVSVCREGKLYCEATQTEAYYATGRSAYDFLHFGDYDEDHWVEEFLNYPEIRHEIGVDHEAHHGRDAPQKFLSCSDAVGDHFASTGDTAHPSYQHVANLVESGIRVLLYSGTRDFICNAIGNEWWTSALPWSGQEQFARTPMKPWYAAGELAGEYRHYGNLYFGTIFESGHFVPLDQPIRALTFARDWLSNPHEAFSALSSP